MARPLPIIIATEADARHAVMAAISLRMGKSRLPYYDVTEVQILLVPTPKSARADWEANVAQCQLTPDYLPMLAGTREATGRLGQFLEEIEAFVSLDRHTGVYAIDPQTHDVMEKEKAFLAQPANSYPVRITNLQAQQRLGPIYREGYVYYLHTFLKLPPKRLAHELGSRVNQTNDGIKIFKLKIDAKLIATQLGFAIDQGGQVIQLGAAIVASGNRTLDLLDGFAHTPTSKDYWILRQIQPLDGLVAEPFVYSIAEAVADRVKYQALNDCPAQIARQIQETVQEFPPQPLIQVSGTSALATDPNSEAFVIGSLRLRARLALNGTAIPKVFPLADVPIVAAHLTDMVRQIGCGSWIIQELANRDWCGLWDKALLKTPSLAAMASTDALSPVQILSNSCIGCPDNGK